MKRILLLAFVGLATASVALLAEEMTTGPVLVVTGSVTIGIGDTDTGSWPDLPSYAPFEATTATATIGVASADEKVSATVDLDLLAGATAVTKTAVDMSDLFASLGFLSTPNPLAALPYASTTYMQYARYNSWVQLGLLVAWYNGYADDVIGSGTTSIWDSADITALIATLTSLNYVSTDNPDGTFDDGSTAAEFVLVGTTNDDGTDWDETTVQTGGYLEDIAAALTAFTTGIDGLDTAVDDAVENILDTAASLTLNAINTAAGVKNFLGQVQVAGTTQADEFIALTQADRDLLEQAADLVYTYGNVGADNDLTLDGTSTLTSNVITGATLKFNKLFGLIDIAYLFGGQHAAAGSINVDSSGHQSDAVKAYSGLTLGLASDVVPGLNAGVGLYIDSNGVAAAVDDSWYTLFDETVAADTPMYGLGVNAGYIASIGEDIKAGAKAYLGLYDLLGTPVFAFSVKPTFSGFGAAVDAEFAYGLGGLMYLKAGASYTIKGITPSATFHMVKPGASGKFLAYAETPSSVLAKVKNGDGIAIEAGLQVDVAALVGGTLPLDLAPSVNGGLTYGMLTAATGDLAWNAGVSIGLLKVLTIAGGLSADPVGNEATGTLDWNASVAVKYSIATIKAQVKSAYSAADDRAKIGYSLTGTVSF